MKTFILTIFKGQEIKVQKTVVVETREDLSFQKNGFWSEYPFQKTCWMGVKRIR